MRVIAAIVAIGCALPAFAEWDTVVDRGHLATVNAYTQYNHDVLVDIHDLLYAWDQREKFMANDLSYVRQWTNSSYLELRDIDDRMATVVSLLTAIQAGGIEANMTGVESRLDAVNGHLTNLQALVGVVQTNTGETVAELVEANEWLEDLHGELLGLRDDLDPLLAQVDHDGLNVKVKDLDVLIAAVEAIQGGGDMSDVVEALNRIDERLHVELSAGDWDLIEAVMSLGVTLDFYMNNLQYEMMAANWKLENLEALAGAIQTNTGETVAELVEVNQHLAAIEGFTDQTAGYLELIDAELQLQGLTLDDLLVEHAAQGLDIAAIRGLLEDWLDDEDPGSVGGGSTPGFELPEGLEGDELYPDDWTDYPTEAEAQRDLMEFQLGQVRQTDSLYMVEDHKVEAERPMSNGNYVFAYDFSSLFGALGISGLPTSWQWELKSEWYDAHLRSWVFTAGILFASWAVAWMVWAETRKG